MITLLRSGVFLSLALLLSGRASAADGVNATNLFAPPEKSRPLKVAIYEGPGSGDKGVVSVSARARQIPGTVVTALKPEAVGAADLSGYDLIIFSGGSGSAQAKAIGEAGRQNVRRFVEGGGGYLGVCAGAYLACAGFDWGLGILNAKTVSNKWQRGRGTMEIELAAAGRPLLGDVKGRFFIRYANGPIIQPLGRAGLEPYQVAAFFRTEIANNGTPVGVMKDSPAIVYSTFGKGRVMTISPHSEDTPGLENLIPRALVWLGRN